MVIDCYLQGLVSIFIEAPSKLMEGSISVPRGQQGVCAKPKVVTPSAKVVEKTLVIR